jgi:hypothetical protein
MRQRIVEIPCSCALTALLNPEWEGPPCACIGPPSFCASDGTICQLGLVVNPYADPPLTPDRRLAELVLHGRERMSTPEWVAAIKNAASEVLERRSGR